MTRYLRSIEDSAIHCETHAYAVLLGGGCVLLQTDEGYGLVALRDAAVQRICELKGRSTSKRCVTLADASVIDDLAFVPDRRVLDWTLEISRRTPIAVITAVNPRSALLAGLSPYMTAQATIAGTIATFHNAGALVMRLAARAWADGLLLLGSSANASSKGNNYRLADVPIEMRAGADLVIDDGLARYHHPDRIATTMLDLTRGTFQRRGINYGMIEASWRKFSREPRGEEAEDGAALAVA